MSNPIISDLFKTVLSLRKITSISLSLIPLCLYTSIHSAKMVFKNIVKQDFFSTNVEHIKSFCQSELRRCTGKVNQGQGY